MFNAIKSARTTTHRGLRATNWLLLSAYVMIGILVVAVLVFWFLDASESPSAARMAGVFGGVLLLLYSGGGILTYPASFKDAAYLRGTGGRWRPRWWRYIGFGVGAPTAAAIVATAVGASAIVAPLWILVHAASAWLMSAAYLYHRHEFVGVP